MAKKLGAALFAILACTAVGALAQSSGEPVEPPPPGPSPDLTSKAGIVMTFSQRFFDAHQPEVNAYLRTKMNGLTLPDHAPEIPLGSQLPKVIFGLSKQHIRTFSMSDDCEFVLSLKEPQILFKLHDVNLEFDFEYAMRSEPAWI